MSFLYPNFFYGFLFLSVPIIIHFFNFQRPVRVYFTNIVFLQEIKTDTKARNKLKHLLVLLMRMAFITALVFTFSEPVIYKEKNAGIGEEKYKSKYVSIYMDNSLSMKNINNEKNLLTVGSDYIKTLVESFKQEYFFQLLGNESIGKTVGFWQKSTFLEKQENITYSTQNHPLNIIQNYQIESFKRAGSSGSNSIFWISDFQKSTLGDLEKLVIDTTQNYYLVPLQGHINGNVFVDSLWLDKPFIREKENNICFVQLYNQGAENITDLQVKLFIADKEVSAQIINLPANTKKTVELNFVRNQSDRLAKIVFDDYAIDFDNNYFFVLPPSPIIKIAHITEDKKPFIEKVYSEEDFFEVQNFDYNTFNHSRLKGFDLVILENLPNLNSALLNELYTLNQEFTSLVIFPHPQSDLETYKQLTALTIRKLKQVDKVELTPPNNTDVFFKDVLLEINPNMSMPIAKPVWQWRNSNTNLINFKNGNPFLSFSQNTSSPIYLFSTPLDLAFTNLPYHALFVPIMYKLAINSINYNNKVSYYLDDFISTIKLKNLKKDQIFLLSNAEKQIIPNQKIINNQLVFDIPAVDIKSGFYNILDNKTDSLVDQIAFNYAKKESMLSSYSFEALENFAANYDNVHVLKSNNPSKLLESLNNSQGLISLWQYFAILALLFLLLEIIFIRL